VLFVRQAGTPATRAACFPAGGEHPDAASLARAASLRVDATPRAFAAPAPAAVRTAQVIGLAPTVIEGLAEADYGRWSGLPYADVAKREPDALARWLADPDASPHGGESLAALARRIAGWLDSVRAEPAAVVVCDAGVIRAALGHALGLGPLTSNRFDLAPLSTTALAAAHDGWRVAHVNRKVVS
jgi:broad specificity phosphatase PhoE